MATFIYPIGKHDISFPTTMYARCDRNMIEAAEYLWMTCIQQLCIDFALLPTTIIATMNESHGCSLNTHRSNTALFPRGLRDLTNLTRNCRIHTRPRKRSHHLILIKIPAAVAAFTPASLPAAMRLRNFPSWKFPVALECPRVFQYDCSMYCSKLKGKNKQVSASY